MSHRGCRKNWSIRSQLLLAVNLILGVVILVLLGLRYEREMRQAVKEKHANLDDEAIAIHAAVSHLSREHAAASVQQYIDNVCRLMCDSRSPDHSIVVQLEGTVLQAVCQHAMSNALPNVGEMLDVSTAHQANSQDGTLVVGMHSSSGIKVYTSQSLATIRRAVRRDVLLQLGVIAGLGVLAAAVVNFVLLRIVSQPLRQLVQTVDQIGAGQLGTEAPATGSLEMVRIAEAINTMSRSLDNHERDRRRRMQKAWEIQQHLLPHHRNLPGVDSAHLFEPADEVAGDYFDFLELRDGSWLICIADVSGHGVPAAMGVAMLKMLLLVAAERDEIDPVSILNFANQKFCESTLPEHFASMFLGRWHPKSQSLDYASAGHEPPLLLTAGGAMESLSGTGLLLGVDPDAEWMLQTAHLAQGDRMLFFSDGVIESRANDGELFGRVRLAAWFSRYAELAPDQTVAELAQKLSDHRSEQLAEDDLTLLILDVTDASQSERQCSEPSEASAA